LDRVKEEKRNTLKYVLWGVGALVLIPFLLLSSIAVRTWLPLREADSAGIELEERFGNPDSFTPDPHGAVSSARMEAFLEVRQSMMEFCPSFEALEATFHEIDEEFSEHALPTGEEILDVTGTMFGTFDDLTPLVGKFFKTRNQALLKSEMGVGEYIYLFTASYGDRLTDADVLAMVFADGVPIAPESAEVLRGIYNHQLERLIATGTSREERTALEAETERLRLDHERIPWQEGLPARLSTSLVPYRAELDRQFCPQTAGLDIDLRAGRALAIALY
jgi:hypothetical protein